MQHFRTILLGCTETAVFFSTSALAQQNAAPADGLSNIWDTPAACGPHKPLYNRWKWPSEAGVFIRMMAGLSATQSEHCTIMTDETCLTRRTAQPTRTARLRAFG